VTSGRRWNCSRKHRGGAVAAAVVDEMIVGNAQGVSAGYRAREQGGEALFLVVDRNHDRELDVHIALTRTISATAAHTGRRRHRPWPETAAASRGAAYAFAWGKFRTEPSLRNSPNRCIAGNALPTPMPRWCIARMNPAAVDAHARERQQYLEHMPVAVVKSPIGSSQPVSVSKRSK